MCERNGLLWAPMVERRSSATTVCVSVPSRPSELFPVPQRCSGSSRELRPGCARCALIHHAQGARKRTGRNRACDKRRDNRHRIKSHPREKRPRGAGYGHAQVRCRLRRLLTPARHRLARHRDRPHQEGLHGLPGTLLPHARQPSRSSCGSRAAAHTLPYLPAMASRADCGDLL